MSRRELCLGRVWCVVCGEWSQLPVCIAKLTCFGFGSAWWETCTNQIIVDGKILYRIGYELALFGRQIDQFGCLFLIYF